MGCFFSSYTDEELRDIFNSFPLSNYCSDDVRMTLQSHERSSGVYFRVEYFDDMDETLQAVERLTEELKSRGLKKFIDFVVVANERPEN